MLILECVEPRRKGAGDQIGWATAHSQFHVATLQWCRDRRGATCTIGPPACTTKDFCARARRHVREAITTNLLGHSVAIERSSIVTDLALPVS